MKTSRTHYANRHGMAGYGNSGAAAKADAANKIERLIAEAGTPTFVQFRTYLLVVFRSSVAWCYTIINSADRAGDGSVLLHPFTCTGDSYGDTVRRGRLHLAQYACNPVADDDCLEVIAEAADASQHQRWCDWQRRFHAFKLVARAKHPDWTDDAVRLAFDRIEMGQPTTEETVIRD